MTNTAEAASLRIDNYSGLNVTAIYISPNGKKSWGQNQISGKSISHGATWTVYNLPANQSNRYWDVRIDFSDGTNYRWWQKDLSRYRRMSVYQRGSDMFSDWE